MGKSKDLAEKMLENHNDVFADIINGIVFHGKEVIKSDELKNDILESGYSTRNSGVLRGQERDVAKLWTKNGVKFALYGLENQTRVDRYMPIRMMSYDAASYRDMLNRDQLQIYPVLSLVLYFGSKPWTAPRTIKELLIARQEFTDKIDKYLNDAKANICEVSFLSEEEVNRFHGDFRIVADFFSKKRGNPNYIPQDRQKMEHVEEVLYLLSAVTGDNRYQEICEENIEEVQTMCDVAQRLEDRGIEKGKSEGERDGSLKMLYRLVASKALDIDVAVKEAKKYGVKDAVDFRRLAKLAGYEIK